jgi:hypothetical protein
MKHFLLTRFNLKNRAWEATKDTIPKGLTKEWLINRIELFQNYCLPSVKNQTNKNFIWVIILDVDTPDFFKDKLKSILNIDLNIKLIFADGFNGLTPTLLNEIKNITTPKDKYIITTRLDNDDIIHKDFVKTIQDLYKPHHNTIIDLKNGYQLSNKNQPDIRFLGYNFNPFISLIESSNMFKTVLLREHLQWKFYCKKHISYSKRALWIQLIHSKNQANTKISYLKRIRTFYFKDFGIDIKIKEYSKIENTLYNIKILPKRIYGNIFMFLKLRILNSKN